MSDRCQQCGFYDCECWPTRKAAHLRVIPQRYRKLDGFGIVGQDTHGRRVRVFTETRSSAERIRARIQAGLEIRLDDFAA